MAATSSATDLDVDNVVDARDGLAPRTGLVASDGPLATKKEPEDEDEGDESTLELPERLSLFGVFKMFLLFGLTAFGGPIANIANMKEEIVVKRKWITPKRFHRVLAVYQVLPGPEAAELAMYFGFIQCGRLGGFLAGLGFILPGFVLLFMFAALYKEFNVTSDATVQASLKGMQVTVAAMVLNACVKLGNHAFSDAESHRFSWMLGGYGLLAFILTAMDVHFLITLAFCGIAHVCLTRRTYVWRWRALVLLAFMGGMAGYGVYVHRGGKPGPIAFTSSGLATNGDEGGIFALGLLGGLLTFGGAYTVIPFMYNDFVVSSAVVKSQEFLDALAVTNVMPTPLVMFCLPLGYFAASAGGAILVTMGMFIPAFSFTLLGHRYLSRAIHSPVFHPFLDGISASIVGVVLVTAFDFARKVVETGLDGVVYLLVIMALQQFKHRLTSVVIIFAAAAAGHVLYYGEITTVTD